MLIGGRWYPGQLYFPSPVSIFSSHSLHLAIKSYTGLPVQDISSLLDQHKVYTCRRGSWGNLSRTSRPLSESRPGNNLSETPGEAERTGSGRENMKAEHNFMSFTGKLKSSEPWVIKVVCESAKPFRKLRYTGQSTAPQMSLVKLRDAYCRKSA